MSATFFQAAAIVFREGLETLLMLGAVVAYLRAQNSINLLPALIAGAGLALIAATVVTLLLGYADKVMPPVVQGVAMLAAALAMLYLSGWFLVQRASPNWRLFLQRHAQDAVARGAGPVIMLIAFAVVFREASEVILFLNALVLKSGGLQSEILAGIAVAAIGLIAAGVGHTRASARLPLRVIFLATSALFFLTAILFLGDALEQFQLLKYVSTTPINPLVVSSFHALGLNASWEAVVVQCSVIGLAIVGAIGALQRTGQPAIKK